MATQAVRIEGLRELDRAFKLYGRGLEKGVREALEAAAEVVRPEAQSLAGSLPHMGLNKTGIPWSSMRVGVTKRTAYVAPTRRGTGRSRGRQAETFKRRLLERAMEPALERNIPRVEQELGDALDDLGRMWSRV